MPKRTSSFQDFSAWKQSPSGPHLCSVRLPRINSNNWITNSIIKAYVESLGSVDHCNMPCTTKTLSTEQWQPSCPKLLEIAGSHTSVRLPDEILTAIFDKCVRDTLTKLVRCNKKLKAICAPLLYQHICLQDPTSSHQKFRHLVEVASFLTANNLGPCVRSITIEGKVKKSCHFLSDVEDAFRLRVSTEIAMVVSRPLSERLESWEDCKSDAALAIILAQATKLERLKICADLKIGSCLSKILARCPSQFDNLKNLYFCSWERYSIVPFLQLPALKDLRLKDCNSLRYEDEAPLPDFAPQLQSLTLYYPSLNEDLGKVVRRCPNLVHVDILFPNAVSEEDGSRVLLSVLAKSCKRLESLRLKFCSPVGVFSQPVHFETLCALRRFKFQDATLTVEGMQGLRVRDHKIGIWDSHGNEHWTVWQTDPDRVGNIAA